MRKTWFLRDLWFSIELNILLFSLLVFHWLNKIIFFFRRFYLRFSLFAWLRHWWLIYGLIVIISFIKVIIYGFDWIFVKLVFVYIFFTLYQPKHLRLRDEFFFFPNPFDNIDIFFQECFLWSEVKNK